MSDREDYERLSAEIKKCTACSLCASRHEVVVDRGNPEGRLLFIGEAPGASEDAEGKAFVGPAGEVLDGLIADAGIKPDQFLIINVLKCRPPNNAFPGDERSVYTEEEIVPKCLPWLDKQIELVRPKAIVLVGRKAAEWTIYRNRRPAPNMGDIAFRWYRTDRYPRVEIFAMYHTAYLLRVRQRDPGEARRLEEQTRLTMRWASDVINGTLPDGKPTNLRSAEKRPEQGRFF